MSPETCMISGRLGVLGVNISLFIVVLVGFPALSVKLPVEFMRVVATKLPSAFGPS